MSGEPPHPRDELRELRSALADLQVRVTRLEQSRTPAPALVVAPSDEPPPPELAAGIAKAPLYAGRLLLVFGGAYLLRALTEGEQVPASLGAALGLAYGLFWLLLAHAAGRRGDAYTATWHALAGALIVDPLLWETSARFDILSFGLAALLLATITLAALRSALRAGGGGRAGILAAGATLAALAMQLPHPQAALPMTAGLLLLALAALWLGRAAGRLGAAAILIAGCALASLLLAHAVLGGRLQGSLAAVLLLVAVATAFVGSTVLQTVARRRHPDAFDVYATLLALVAGFGGSLLVARTTDTARLTLGLGTLGVAVAGYVLAFTVLDRDRRRCFHYLTGVSLLLVLAGSAALLRQPAWPWSALAAATALTARRFGRATLGMHAGLYALAAAGACGALAHGGRAWLDSGLGLPAGPEPWAAVATLGLVSALRVRCDYARAAWASTATRAATLLALVISGGGFLLTLAAHLVAPYGHGWEAAARSVAVALVALVLAAVARTTAWQPTRRLAQALLAVGALKLLFEDLPAGQPLTLSVSFAAYGVALILASRWTRSAGIVSG